MSFITLPVKNLSQSDVYKLMIGGIIPRPIAFISTLNESGSVNLAPFSFFNGVSSKPACVVVSIGYKSNDDKKDTLRNIERTKEFVINSADESIITSVVATAAAYDYDVSELEATELTPITSTVVKPPRISESSFQMECSLHQVVRLGDDTDGNQLVIGKIEVFHVKPEIYKDGKIDYQFYKPAARLGGINYAKLADIYQIPIPKV